MPTVKKISESVEIKLDDDGSGVRERREREVSRLFTHMIWLNIGLAVLIASFASVELYGVWFGQIDAGERMIDSKVVIAFITAITVQVGTIALTGSRWFFRN